MHYGTVWIASIVSLRETSSHKIVYDISALRPIARTEHGRSKRSRSPQPQQALTIVCVMFSYNRPVPMVKPFFEVTAVIETIGAIIWEPTSRIKNDRNGKSTTWCHCKYSENGKDLTGKWERIIPYFPRIANIINKIAKPRQNLISWWKVRHDLVAI